MIRLADIRMTASGSGSKFQCSARWTIHDWQRHGNQHVVRDKSNSLLQPIVPVLA